MNCPVCKRDNAFTLSICPSCGTMINDSVREELISKITPLVKPIPKPEHIDLRGDLNVQNKPKMSLPNREMNSFGDFELKRPDGFSSEIKREIPVTSDFGVKNTSPTLVEFHNKNAPLPEWRLQLKNAVRQRTHPSSARIDSESSERSIEIADSPTLRRKNLVTSGANALKVEQVSEIEHAVVSNGNPKLAAALKRIERSRKEFLEVEQPLTFSEPAKPNNSLLYFTAKPNDHLRVSSNAVRFESSLATPVSLKSNDEKLDTNKLPELPKAAEISSSFSKTDVGSELIKVNFGKTQADEGEIAPDLEEIEDLEVSHETEDEVIELQEIDDCAPITMRFNSGLFDLIIGSFVSLLLLVPFMSFGGEWFGVAGIFAFAATTAIVMFLYLTTAVALYGRTFGMRLFSLEIIDIEGEEYPTIHQSAVSACVYMLSLICGGIGFITLFFNDEGRAAHDLVSRTIVVKEF